MLKIDVIKDAFDKRPRHYPWVGIVIHHTGIGDKAVSDNSLWSKLFTNIGTWLTAKDDNELSAHYLIGRAGELSQLVDPETHVAYHAGKSSFWHPVMRKWVEGCNDHFVGIEIIGDGNLQPYSTEQYSRCAEVCRYLIDKYKINPNMIVGHEMISPGRKFDPGKAFEWAELYGRIYGN